MWAPYSKEPCLICLCKLRTQHFAWHMWVPIIHCPPSNLFLSSICHFSCSPTIRSATHASHLIMSDTSLFFHLWIITKPYLLHWLSIFQPFLSLLFLFQASIALSKLLEQPVNWSCYCCASLSPIKSNFKPVFRVIHWTSEPDHLALLIKSFQRPGWFTGCGPAW